MAERPDALGDPRLDDPALRLAAPARRALAAAGHRRLGDLAAVPEAEVAALHGVGPNALRVLRAALARRGRGFAEP